MLHLLRFLLSLALRLRLSSGRIVLGLRARSTSIWKTILAFTSRRHHSCIRLHACDDPSMSYNPTAGEAPQLPGPAGAEEHTVTPAAFPVPSTIQWQDELSRCRALTSARRALPDPVLVPATPQGGSRRYEPREVRKRRDTDPPVDIPAGQQKILTPVSLPDRWRRHVHPEGVALFYHEGLHVFTESDIKNSKDEDEILHCAMILVEKALQMSTDGVTLDEYTEIVLNVDNQRRWRYYFVDHTHRLLFWVDAVNANDLGVDLPVVTEFNHIRYMVEAYYWYTFLPSLPIKMTAFDMESRTHCEFYPHISRLPKQAFEELRGMLNYAKTDILTADSPSSPFGQDELVAILDLVNSLKDDEISDPYSIWIVARLMAYFIENQFLNFCGQPCARLNADTPLFGKQTWNHRKVFRAFNWFLLGAPNEHAVRLQRVWVDGIIIEPRWKDFTSRLKDELGRYTIFSTVMLAVNFSFLAVPGVIDPTKTAGPIEILIYCSVVSTIASIVFSFGLLNVYSNPDLTVARHAVSALSILSHGKSGMACLAITHSLPLGSLIWSIALFSAALGVQIFGPGERGMVATLSIECAVIVFFVGIGVSVMRLFGEDGDGGAGDADRAGASAKKPLPQAVPIGAQDAQRDVERGQGS